MKTELADIFAVKKRVCLWLSGGSDSLLLLQVLLEENRDFSVLRFSDGWTRAQKKAFDLITIKNKLQVYSYAANSHVLVGDKKGSLALASEYAIGAGAFIPIVRDIVDSPRCSFDIPLEVLDVPRPPIYFDAHIFGSRAADRHFVFGSQSFVKVKSFRHGRAHIFAPLRDWKKSQVKAALNVLGIRFQVPSYESDTGNISACTNCLTQKAPFCPKLGKEIAPVEDFDAVQNLKIFREKLGIIQRSNKQ